MTRYTKINNPMTCKYDNCEYATNTNAKLNRHIRTCIHDPNNTQYVEAVKALKFIQ